MPICLYDIVPGRDAVARTSAAEYLAKAAKRGEGSHGGHIIGHTKSGKAIYGHRSEVHQGIRSSFPPTSQKDRSHSGFKTARRDNLALVMRTHPNFTAHEHVDAARAHAKKSQAGKRRWKDFGYNGDTPDDYKKATDDHELHAALQNAHAEAAEKLGWTPEMSSTYKSLTKAAKKGEGSRGGHIIGHTKSGKPVYAASHASYNHLQETPGYHKYPHDVTVKDIHKVMYAYPGFTAQDHSDAADAHEDINHHTAASAHASAASFVFHGGKGDEDREASWNDLRGSAAHGYGGPKRVDDALGRTYNDHGIPDLDHPKYHGVATFKRSGVTSDDVPHREANGRVVQASFKGFKAVDHEMAAKAHTRQAKEKRDNGAYHLGENPDSEFGHKALHESRHHAAIAQAHNDMAEFLRRKKTKKGDG